MFDVRRVQGRSFDEGNAVFLRERFRLVARHRTQMSQIGFVSHQRDDGVRIGVIAQLLQPPVDVLVTAVFADVVDEQRADGAPVVTANDRIEEFRLSSFSLSLTRW